MLLKTHTSIVLALAVGPAVACRLAAGIGRFLDTIAGRRWTR